MSDAAVRYPRYRFPPAIISHAVWLYYRFSLSFRDVEDLLAERGITVSYETIRHWCDTFGLAYARRLRRRAGPVGDTWYLDELFVTIHGQRHVPSGAPSTRTATSSISCSSPTEIATPRHGSFESSSNGAGASPAASSPTASAVTEPPTGTSCRPSATTPPDTRTIVPRSPTSPRAAASTRCGGSNQARRPSVFSVFTASCDNLFSLGRHLLRAAHQRLLRSARVRHMERGRRRVTRSLGASTRPRVWRRAD